jgi:hypothetical protein
MLSSELQESDECNFTYMIWMKETVISPSTSKSYFAMIQDFNKSETHAWELLLGTPPPPQQKKPITEHDYRCAFHQLTYAVFPSPVSKLLYIWRN